MNAEIIDKKSSFPAKVPEDVWALLISGLLIAAVLIIAFSSPGFKFTTPTYQWSSLADLSEKVFASGNILLLAILGGVFLLLSSLPVILTGESPKKYISGFVLIYLLGLASLIIAGNKTINYYGVEYVVFALIFGLLISNLLTLPSWLKAAARSEFFIKTGLVILGTSILFTDIVRAGTLAYCRHW